MANTDKPFIKKFKISGRFFAYDVNTNLLLEVDECAFDLCEAVKGDSLIIDQEYRCHAENKFGVNVLNNAVAVIEGLLKSGIFSCSRPCNVIAGPPLYNPSRLDAEIGQLVLEVTERCNMSCKYCISKKGNYHYGKSRNPNGMVMAKSVAASAIDFYWSRSSRADHRAIGFYGGEPFLAQDIMEFCINYAMGKLACGEDVSFNATTNGTLLDPGVIRFAIKHKIRLLVSLDGPAAIHDQVRKFNDGKGSFNKIVGNLKGALEIDPDYFYNYIAISCVIYDQSRIGELFDFFETPEGEWLAKLNWRFSGVTPTNRAFDVASLMPLGPTPIRIKHTDADNVRPDIFFEFLAALNDSDRESPRWALLRNLFHDPYLRIHKRPIRRLGRCVQVNGSCLPGLRKIYVDHLGVIHSCERVNSTFPLGTTKDGFFPDSSVKVLGMLADFVKTRCLSCWAIRLCGACVATVQGDGGIGLDAANFFCENELSKWDFALKCYCDVLNDNPAAFDYLESVIVA